MQKLIAKRDVTQVLKNVMIENKCRTPQAKKQRTQPQKQHKTTQTHKPTTYKHKKDTHKTHKNHNKTQSLFKIIFPNHFPKSFSTINFQKSLFKITPESFFKNRFFKITFQNHATSDGQTWLKTMQKRDFPNWFKKVIAKIIWYGVKKWFKKVICRNYLMWCEKKLFKKVMQQNVSNKIPTHQNKITTTTQNTRKNTPCSFVVFFLLRVCFGGVFFFVRVFFVCLFVFVCGWFVCVFVFFLCLFCGCVRFFVSCGKNMLDVCCEVSSCDVYVAMVKTEKRMSAQPACCYTVTFATRSLLRRSVVPAKFLLGTSTRCLQNVRHQTRWWWYGLGTKHAMDHGTWHWTDLDWARTHETCHSASLDSRLYPSKRSVAHTIHALIVSSCVVSSRVLRRPHQGPFRVLTPRMVAERAVTPYGSTAVHHDDHWWVDCQTGQSRSKLGDGSHRQTHSGHECQDQSRWRSPAADTMSSNRLEGCSFVVRGIQHLGQRWKDQGFSVELDSRLNRLQSSRIAIRVCRRWGCQVARGNGERLKKESDYQLTDSRVQRVLIKSAEQRRTQSLSMRRGVKTCTGEKDHDVELVTATHKNPLLHGLPTTHPWQVARGDWRADHHCRGHNVSYGNAHGYDWRADVWCYRSQTYSRNKSWRAMLSFPLLSSRMQEASWWREPSSWRLVTWSWWVPSPKQCVHRSRPSLRSNSENHLLSQQASADALRIGRPKRIERWSGTRRNRWWQRSVQRRRHRNTANRSWQADCQPERESDTWRMEWKAQLSMRRLCTLTPTHWEIQCHEVSSEIPDTWNESSSSRDVHGSAHVFRVEASCGVHPTGVKGTACSAEYGTTQAPTAGWFSVTHLQVLQEVKVRDPPPSHDWPTGGCSRRVARGSGHREQVVVVPERKKRWESYKVCKSGTPPSQRWIDSKPQSIQPHLQSKPAQARHGVPWGSRVSASATANSDTGRGRDECLRVNFRKVFRKRDAHNVNKSDWKMWFKKSEPKKWCKNGLQNVMWHKYLKTWYLKIIAEHPQAKNNEHNRKNNTKQRKHTNQPLTNTKKTHIKHTKTTTKHNHFSKSFSQIIFPNHFPESIFKNRFSKSLSRIIFQKSFFKITFQNHATSDGQTWLKTMQNLISQIDSKKWLPKLFDVVKKSDSKKWLPKLFDVVWKKVIQKGDATKCFKQTTKHTETK